MQQFKSPRRGHRNPLGVSKVIPCGICILVIVLAWGCSTPEERARKLFNSGRYEEVLRLYPYLEIAHKAKSKIAERLLQEGRYEEILQEYPTSPSAPEARKAVAKRLLEAGEYEKVAINYSETPSGWVARDSLAERLYREGSFQTLLLLYPNTPAADRIQKHHPEVIRAKLREERQRQQDEEKGAAERRRRCRRYPSLCLHLGMGPTEVRTLIGKPDDVNRTVTPSGMGQYVTEQWVYEIGGYYSYEAVYLYFENGALVSWQE
jgi:hypothetical protein